MPYRIVRDIRRVGHHADPLAVTLEYQDGSGRFDDPQRSRTVLYGAEDVRTCILESAMPWASQHVLAVPEPHLENGEHDDVLFEQMQRDAARDRALAAETLMMPGDLYGKKKVYVELRRPLDLLDLDDVRSTRALYAVDDVRTVCRSLDVTQIDRGVLTGRDLDITRAISGHLIRHPLFGVRNPGLACPSRHPGAKTAFVFFQDRYELRLPPITEAMLSPADPDVQSVAADLGLVP